MLVHGNADCREILPSQSAAAIAGDSFYMRRILERFECGVLTISDATRPFSSQQVVRSATYLRVTAKFVAHVDARKYVPTLRKLVVGDAGIEPATSPV
jgi:hypothetical protein